MQITRRSFAGMCAALPALAGCRHRNASAAWTSIYDIFGVPLRTGSLYPGTENDAIAYREAGIIDQFRSAGMHAADRGDIRHSQLSPAPLHSSSKKLARPAHRLGLCQRTLGESLKQPGHVPLLIGCDCSIVVGTAQALTRAGSRELHVLYIDGDFDDAAPQAHVSQQRGKFCGLASHQCFAVLGRTGAETIAGHRGRLECSFAIARETRPILLSLAEIRKIGIRESAARVLERIPPSTDILIHLDIDVLTKQEMPAAYFPHSEGLTLARMRRPAPPTRA